MGVLENPDKGFLGQIHSQFVVVKKVVEVVDEPVLVTVNQSLERVLVAFQIGGDECIVSETNKRLCDGYTTSPRNIDELLGV